MKISPNERTLTPLLNEFVLNDQYRQTWWLSELRHQFRQMQYAYFPNLFTPTAFAFLKSEADRLKQFTLARNYEPDGPGTARNMKTFGGDQLFEESAIFSMIYVHHEIRSLLSEVVDAPVYHCVHEEVIGLNYLADEGNTHGWHLDNGAFDFIMIFDTPTKVGGGMLEFIPRWDFYAKERGADQSMGECIQNCYEKNLVQTQHHAPGDAYLIRGDRALHHVTPLQHKGDKRLTVAMEYSYTPEPINLKRGTGLYGSLN